MDFGLILSWVWDGFSGFELILSCFVLILSYFWFGFVNFVFGLSNVEMGFVDCGGRPVKKQRKTKRKKTKKKDTDER